MPCQKKSASVTAITINYRDEPSTFAREIQTIFTRARNKAVTDLRKKDFQPVGSDAPTATKFKTADPSHGDHAHGVVFELLPTSKEC